MPRLGIGLAARRNREIATIPGMPDAKPRIETLSGEIVPDKPEEPARFMAADTPRWKTIIAETGMRVH